jgi:hypothetical protein
MPWRPRGVEHLRVRIEIDTRPAGISLFVPVD